ncbi:MAG: DUF664 domain-containing protein [Spirochaetaceae bacterium]|nr:MAG: DUF664 domain-containing protein [Spirochaetaceae bacterium]
MTASLAVKTELSQRDSPFGYPLIQGGCMKPIFEMLAAYNGTTNTELVSILSELTDEDLARKIGGFFLSIVCTLNHILMADIVWLRRLVHAVPELKGLKHELPEYQASSLSDTPWPTFPMIRPVRDLVDGQLVDAATAIPEASLTERITYRNTRGEKQEKTLSVVLLHVFNHQTHHRGQIALMLDELGVENDYSNLISKFG